MSQTRWVLLEVEVSDEKVNATEEELQRKFISVDEFIEWEVQWLNESFDSVSILEITSELDHNVFEE